MPWPLAACLQTPSPLEAPTLFCQLSHNSVSSFLFYTSFCLKCVSSSCFLHGMPKCKMERSVLTLQDHVEGCEGVGVDLPTKLGAGGLTENEVVRPEEVTKGPRADAVHGPRLQIHQDGPRHILVSCKERGAQSCRLQRVRGALILHPSLTLRDGTQGWAWRHR